jgi:hypothetical protein
MSAATEADEWEKIRETMATLELHLDMASNHKGVLTMDKRRELGQRLDSLKAKLAQATSEGH